MPDDTPPRPRRPPVPMPANIVVKEEPAPREQGYRDAPAAPRLVIVYRWYSPAVWAIFAFLVAWFGFIGKWLADSSTPAPIRLFPVIHLCAGLVMLYVGVAVLVNRTTLAVIGGELRIRSGPLPWIGNKVVEVADLAQIYCEEQIVQGKNGPTKNHHLSALTRTGEKLRLLSNMMEPAQALYLEQRLEEHLGIADAPVPGEYPGARTAPARIAADVSDDEAREEGEDEARRSTRRSL